MQNPVLAASLGRRRPERDGRTTAPGFAVESRYSIILPLRDGPRLRAIKQAAHPVPGRPHRAGGAPAIGASVMPARLS